MEFNYGNKNNNGVVYYDGENIYYSNITSDSGKLYKMNLDFSRREKMSDISNIQYITKDNSYLYYTSENSIYKLNINTKENKIIFSTNNELYVDEIIIINDEMFFSDTYSHTYKMNLNTLIPKKIVSNTFGINIFNNSIYYSLNEGEGLYELNLNNNKTREIVKSRTSYPLIKNNYLYYIDYSEKAFFKINLDTSNYEKEKIVSIKETVKEFNILSNYIIYKDYYLFKIDLNNKKIEQINNKQANEILIINNEIWFVAYENHEFYLYKIDIKGNNLTLID